MVIDTRNEKNGEMCYVCRRTFVQYKKIRYYLTISPEISGIMTPCDGIMTPYDG
jgi:hypothetical protein